MKDYTEDRDLAGIKLLAVDMDLTLLASDGSLPPHMDERIDALAEAGVLFCPASGRPAPTLQMMFPAHADGIAFCADNGGWVIYQGRTAFRDLIRPELWHEVLDFAAGQDPQQLLMPVDAVFAAHPPLIVTLGQAAKLKNGAQVKDWQFQPGTYRVYAEDGEFLLLGRVEGGVLTTIKSFFEVNTLGT